jgi:hypothetical protein
LLWSYLLHSSPLCHATFVLWVILQVAAKFLQDPQFSQVSSFGFLHHLAARCRPLCHLFSVPEDFTAASSLETSQCFA